VFKAHFEVIQSGDSSDGGYSNSFEADEDLEFLVLEEEDIFSPLYKRPS
jgi:hypothetical protein